MRKLIALGSKPAGMRSSMRNLSLAAIAAVAGGVLIWMSAPAAAGPTVDPTTLEPAPPPSCARNTRGLIASV
jgi:hypothetical protein